MEKDQIDIVIKQLTEFSSKCNDKRNLTTFIIKNKEDIVLNNVINNDLIKSLIESLTSSHESINNNTKILPLKFEIEKNKNIENMIKKFQNDFDFDINSKKKKKYLSKKNHLILNLKCLK